MTFPAGHTNTAILGHDAVWFIRDGQQRAGEIWPPLCSPFGGSGILRYAVVHRMRVLLVCQSGVIIYQYL